MPVLIQCSTHSLIRGKGRIILMAQMRQNDPLRITVRKSAAQSCTVHIGKVPEPGKNPLFKREGIRSQAEHL